MKYIPRNKVKENDLKLAINNQNAIINSNGLKQFTEDSDLTDFNNACNLFKSVCSEIGTLLSVDTFHGGYDELLAIISREEMRTEQGKLLSDKLNLANSLCLHEAKKVGLPAPDWFFKCWGLER